MKSKHRRIHNMQTDYKVKAIMIEQIQKQIKQLENMLNLPEKQLLK